MIFSVALFCILIKRAKANYLCGIKCFCLRELNGQVTQCEENNTGNAQDNCRQRPTCQEAEYHWIRLTNAWIIWGLNHGKMALKKSKNNKMLFKGFL